MSCISDLKFDTSMFYIGGCNSIFGNWFLQDKFTKLTITNLFSTKVKCNNKMVIIENYVSKHFLVLNYSINADTLILDDNKVCFKYFRKKE